MMYKEGQNLALDIELKRYRKLRLWRGDAINKVFNDDEFEEFGKLWLKEKQGIQKLTVNDISKLIGFADRIRA